MNHPDPAQPATSWRPWLLVLGLWLLMAAAASVVLLQLRSASLDGQRRDLELLSLALSDEIDRGLRGIEEGVQVLRQEIRQGRLPQPGTALEQDLRLRAELMPLVRVLWILDAQGRVLSASGPTASLPVADFHPGLSGEAVDGVALSRPFDDAPSGDRLVALAFHTDAAAGSPARWIVAGMPARLLLGAFAVALPAADARMAVLRRDGALLASAGGAAPRDGAWLQSGVEPTGVVTRVWPDGSLHLEGRQHVPRYGVTVVVSRAVDAVLTGWRGGAQMAGTGLLLLLAVMAAAVHGVLRAERQRSQVQRSLQVQMARASKLEALGSLAGGVAHDFNNVLAGIVGYAEMAQDLAAPGGDQARHLDRVLKAAERGKALVARVLAFSRGGARAATVFEFTPVIDEVLTLLAADLRPGIVLERELVAPGALLRGDATPCFEAVMNLCVNALQAMPHGGLLGVRLERRSIAERRMLSHGPLPPGEYLVLTVSDQGLGITPEVMEHLFEPFFTTRGAQQGTGLGLAVVHGVVTEMRGAIDVDSAPGRGARFRLYLPECKEPVRAAPDAALAVPRGRGQRVMVIDDDPELVELAVRTLHDLGYDGVGRTDPALALQQLIGEPAGFAAVISDEVMPGCTGTELTRALRRAAIDVPVIVVSAYGGALLATRAAEAGVTRVLGKPIRRAELATALAGVLG